MNVKEVFVKYKDGFYKIKCERAVWGKFKTYMIAQMTAMQEIESRNKNTNDKIQYVFKH